ncbi:DNA damage-binding 1 [Chlorella sorokiniana]|uniref:DNA damage-binding 1 n=1 Tax=Chlorella sorokiniana TaxID=3076 RepID=A0A2P6TBQ7_CHLSO|nr:DNA damage-binding 1 [Chlorella sorokiniana]|eukprot:PRW18316.1 DNA damage-binding 1 [Chlorella sorokiniana]
MLLVTEQVPAPPGALLAASSAPEGHLLVAFDACVASYAATTAPGAAAGNGAGLRRLWHQPVGGGRVQFAAPLAPDAYLLVTRSSSSPGMAHAVVVQVLPTGQHVCTAVDLACSEGHEQPCQRPAFSNLAPCGDGTYMLVAALWQATAHVLHAQQGPGGTWRLTATPSPLGELLTAEPGSVLAVTSLALGPASAQFAPGGRLHVVLLYSSHRLGSGGLAAVQHVACLELQPEDGALHRCCWFLRNVCPTTSLVAPLPGARTLVAAQTSLMVVHADAPHSKQQAAVGLNGSPTAAAALSQNAVVLSDSSGQLLLLDLQSLAATPVATTSLTAGPSCLALLPHPACGTEPAGPADSEQEQCCAAPPAGLLFVGSGGGVLLEVLAAALAGGPAAAEAAAAVGWRVAGGGDGGEGFGSCLAPVAFGQLVPDPSGCDDARLLAGCGEAPFGRLALGRLAAGLTPLAVGSAELPGWVRLLSLKASPAAARHRFLLLTSDEGAGAAGAWTSVLETGEDGLQAAELPGLQTSSATLAAAPLAGGCILQVTPQGAHVFMPGTGEALSSWAPPSGSAVTLAAQHGQHVALACGATVHLLYCSGSGRLQEERHLSLPQQASALTLFRLGTDGRTEGELWLATGLWVANEVLLQPLSRDQPACRLALGSRQCRSVLACSLGSSSSSGSSSGGGEQPAYLIVGSSSEEHPLLAAGCDDGTVRLFRVFVDDAGMEAHHAVEQGLAAIAAAVEPLRLAESSGTGTSEPSAGPAPEQAAADAGDKGSTASSSRQQHLWHQQVALQLLAKAPTCFQGVPASLSVQGTILFARDLLSSLTAYRVQPLAAGQPPTLLPLADDLSGRHLTAALPLTETAVLAGAPEGSLLLLQRDPAAEHSRQAAAKQQFEQTLEAGGGVAAGAAAAQRFTPTLRHAAQLDTVASCELGGSVVEVLPGLMGVPVCPMAELLGGSGSGSSSSQHQPTATAVCSNGTVAAVRLLTPQAHAVLMQLQRAALATSYVEAGDGAATAKLRLSGTGTGTHEGCIDGSSLAAAFTSRSWYARLVKAAPAATIQQGRALLESFGLL